MGARLSAELRRARGVALILVVEEDAEARQARSHGLRAAGYQVIEAASPAAAGQLAADHGPDLLVTSLGAAAGATIALVRAWRAAARGPALALTSAPDDVDLRVAAIAAGADEVIARSASVAELIGWVELHDRALRTTAALREALSQVDNMRLFAGEAVALLAHDLNNGLCVATSNLAYLTEHDAMVSDAEARDAVRATDRALRRMTTLVRNFVDIARSEDGALVPERCGCDVAEIVRVAAAVHQVRPARGVAGAGGAAPVEVDCPPILEAFVDPILFERILHNLLVNATRYVEAGGRVRLRARRGVGPGGGHLIVDVCNTGPAIPAALRESLFEKYRKGKDSKAQTGMGLYFCRLACEAHGGSIALLENAEFSTCFELRLPSDPAA